MNAIGFDLGSYSVKVIEGSFDGKKLYLVRAEEFTHPFGVMLPQDTEQLKQLATMVKEMWVQKKLSTSNLRASLPESVVSTKIVSTPPLTDAELASAIDWLAEQHIAIPLEQLSLEYEVLYRPERGKNENMRVMLIGVPKTVIGQYVNFFNFMEVEPVVLETQTVSLFRSLGAEEMPTTLIVHMGASETNLFIVHDKEIVFVYSVPTGGRLLTRAIERTFSLDTKQAEEYKRSYGLDAQFLEGKLLDTLNPIMNMVVGEMQKALQFFVNQYGTMTVKRILLSGGAANIPGIIPYVAGKLNAEVVVAHPFAQAVFDTKTQVPHDREASFTVAAGLVMRKI